MTHNLFLPRSLACSLGAAGVLAVASCDSPDTDSAGTSEGKVKKEIAEALQVTGDYLEGRFRDLRDASYAKKEEFKAQGEEALRKLDASIEDLEDSLDELGAEARVEAREKIAELKAAREKASDKLKRVGNAGEDAWDDVRSGFNQAYDDLKRAVSKSRDEFRD